MQTMSCSHNSDVGSVVALLGWTLPAFPEQVYASAPRHTRDVPSDSTRGMPGRRGTRAHIQPQVVRHLVQHVVHVHEDEGDPGSKHAHQHAYARTTRLSGTL